MAPQANMDYPDKNSRKIEKRGSSLIETSHRRFPTVSSYVSELGGSKSRVIEKILIANNGNAAVKAIRYMRKWAYEVFGNERIITFVVMATPEDLRSNAEYIRNGDVIVDVPGGSNNNNYANVNLIVEIARLHGVQAVWAGWGHASENPVLPDTLEKCTPPIKFIGPAGPPMRALGDKIGSTIIAQTAGTPCIAWNGSDVKANYNKETGELPAEAYDRANIHTAAEALAAAEKIGFPVMIKASEGGGGKGIRMVSKAEDVKDGYRQVCGEVPGSPIFIMKLSAKSRHLEVQLFGDEYGNAIALNGRDCSVQRRHQKIIEEGPPVAAEPSVWIEMEKAAIALAKAVGYTNAGTVEYLYSEPDEKFYFLELNPRLQVEHPVTENITGVNLPAAQLQVAMGIPLKHIPEIRELYGKNRFVANTKDGSSDIDFETAVRAPPKGHCIAVRITAENAEAGFKPTSGGIQELNFRSTPNVWGYFSMDSSGSIHEFADSQFGHLFANGPDREQARWNMVLALKELSIRGDISTTVDYISKLIEMEDFVENRIDTGWLDALIKKGVSGLEPMSRGPEVKTGIINNHTKVIIGGTATAFDRCAAGEKQFIEALQKGQLPSRSLLGMKHDVELILDGIKYKLCCTRTGPTAFDVSLSNGTKNASVETNVRLLSDGGYLIAVGGKSHVAYMTSKGDAANGMRLTIGGQNVAFSSDYDPTALRIDTAGKLVKKLVNDGDHVTKGEAFGEIEVMKMFMPLKVEESGVVTWNVNEGAALKASELIATLDLDNPDSVVKAKVHDGDMDVDGWSSGVIETNKPSPHILLRQSIDLLHGAISGYAVGSEKVKAAMSDVLCAISDPTLPVFEIKEQLAVLSGRIDANISSYFSYELAAFEKECLNAGENGKSLRFPAEIIGIKLAEYEQIIADPAERAAFTALVTPLKDAASPYVNGKSMCFAGSQRAISSYLTLLREWITAEGWFCDGISYADAVDNLRKTNKEDYETVLKVCRAHELVKETSDLAKILVKAIGDEFKGQTTSSNENNTLSAVEPCLSEIASMKGDPIYTSLAQIARKFLLEESLPSMQERKTKVLQTVEKLGSTEGTSSPAPEVEEFIKKNVPLADVFLPLLKSTQSTSAQTGLLELYSRQHLRSQVLKEVTPYPEERMLKISFTEKTRESVFSASTQMRSMNDLTKIMSRSSSMNSLSGEMSESDSASDLLSLNRGEQVPSNVPRTSVFKIYERAEDLKDKDKFCNLLNAIPQYSKSAPRCQAGPVNILHIAVLEDSVKETAEEMDEVAKKIEALLTPYHDDLNRADIRRVTFIMSQKGYDGIEDNTVPAIFTYRAQKDYKEDSLFRNIEPGNAYHLDLTRLAKNFSVRSLDSRLTTTGHVHLYRATPKITAWVKDQKASKLPRIFVRALTFASEFTSSSFERILVDALNALDVCPQNDGSDNHLFINLVSDYEQVVDPSVVEQVVVSILKRHRERVTRLGVAEVETRVVCCLSADTPPIAIRMVASNPTGYVQVMSTYVEAADDSCTNSAFRLIGGTKATLASSGDSSWEGMDVNTPYPLMRPFDAQRKAAARSSDTLYCYDLPALFEAGVEHLWDSSVESENSSRSLSVMYTNELVVQKKGGSINDAWTLDDYLDGKLELVQMQRGAGANNVGMVAWLMVLKTVEYPQGRQIVLIANDITFKAGSFGTREDVVFKLASEYAREKRIPRLYVAANSGARIGTAEKAKKSFKVAFKEPSKPENGFKFLYVTKDDYERLVQTNKEIQVEPAQIEDPISGKMEDVYKITDVIGSEPDLGVENLKGSGLIAGETSSAYEDIFTMTIVLGRTVGIGAYLVRLGQRTIQKKSSSPIILTGYQALNKLMGCEVYSTNDQLGGPGIMYNNGVTHLVAPDHLSCITSALQWLSFVPSVRGGLLPITDLRGVDVIERSVDYLPQPNIPYDPRHLLAGAHDSKGEWQAGFFDKGSFKETLGGWAKTVIVGRARLGGIPMGVVVTENRTVEAIKPADPADVKASEAIIQEPGGVWFPNSAYKTAQAINDFRTEDLPLMIFANWRGFSGGQRDMYDEVLKYGSMIVDAFVAYEQPIFVFIPPFAEIRGGAWVVVDPSINPAVMEMYATTGTARGGVLEANGVASVKYRTKDLLSTMHRLDDALIALDAKLKERITDEVRNETEDAITKREQSLLPVYEQIAVQFCELHDTPGRMKAVGVIENEVEWENSRSFFFWRLRRKLAEFDLRKKMQQAGDVGRSVKRLSPIEASALMKNWFLQTPGMTDAMWNNDKMMLSWMAQSHEVLEQKVVEMTRDCVAQEVFQVMTAGGNTANVGTVGLIKGLSEGLDKLPGAERESVKEMIKAALKL